MATMANQQNTTSTLTKAVDHTFLDGSDDDRVMIILTIDGGSGNHGYNNNNNPRQCAVDSLQQQQQQQQQHAFRQRRRRPRQREYMSGTEGFHKNTADSRRGSIESPIFVSLSLSPPRRWLLLSTLLSGLLPAVAVSYPMMPVTSPKGDRGSSSGCGAGLADAADGWKRRSRMILPDTDWSSHPCPPESQGSEITLVQDHHLTSLTTTTTTTSFRVFHWEYQHQVSPNIRSLEAEEENGNANQGGQQQNGDGRNNDDNENQRQNNDDDKQHNAGNDDAAAEEDDDINDDDNAANNNDDDNDDDDDKFRSLLDDYFDDGITDDIYSKNNKHYIDDFYAYQEDPGPPTLFPLTNRKIAAYIVASLALMLGAGGGIGGGGVVTPVYNLVLGLPLKTAIPIGAVTVLGGSIGSTYLNWWRRHPLADRPVIDWDVVLVMEPLTLVGTLLGTLFHRLLSEKLLIVLLVLLLSVTAHSTLSKALRMYAAENRYLRQMKRSQQHQEPPVGPMIDPLTVSNTSVGVAPSYTWNTADETSAQSSRKTQKQSQMQSSEDDTAGGDSKRSSISHRRHNHHHEIGVDEKQRILIVNPDFVTLRSDLIEEEKFTPRSKIIALICMFSVLIFLNVMVGGGAFQSPWDIRCGSVSFWIVHLIMTAFLIASAWAAQTYVVARYEIKELVRFDYVHGDIHWDARRAIIYPTVFVTAGLFAGTLGIGGGVITVPILLAMGVHPAVVSATSSAMILFTSVASTSSYLIFGLILRDFALLGFVVGLCSAVIGQSIMRHARMATSANGHHFERNSYIAFGIGIAVLVSALSMSMQYVYTIFEARTEDDGGLCDGLRF